MTFDAYMTTVEQLGPANIVYTDELGNIFAWWEPIFDRVAADCVYGNEKGSITFKTLNRIEANTEFVIYEFSKIGYTYKNNTLPGHWWRKLYFRVTDLNRIIEAIQLLRTSNYVYGLAVPNTVLDNQHIDYVLINLIEENLDVLHTVISGVSKNVRRLGTFTVGTDYSRQSRYTQTYLYGTYLDASEETHEQLEAYTHYDLRRRYNDSK